MPSTGSLKHSRCAWGFLLLHLGVPISSGGEVHIYTQQALGGKDQTFPHGEAPTCCPPTHRHWLQRERATVRNTEACHGSTSHCNSPGCFQKMQKEQSQVLHKTGLDPHHRSSNRYT